MENFSYSAKKVVMWSKLLLLGENKKNPPFYSSLACVWTIINLSNVEADSELF